MFSPNTCTHVMETIKMVDRRIASLFFLKVIHWIQVDL
jgi:hypothetical protein